MNIYDKQWVILSNKQVSNTKFNLAYMTHQDYRADGSPTKSFEQRMRTGKYWAGNDAKIIEFDNSPMDGFKIVGDVSRCTTSNKLFRISDPRGFVVEIPTSNLAELIQQVTIINGIIVGECVWGRDESNHVLLPTNSPSYIDALDEINARENRKTFPKLRIGEIVKFNKDGQDYVYLGKAKGKWIIELYEEVNRCPWGTFKVTKIENDKEIIDDKYSFVFVDKDKPDGTFAIRYSLSGKCYSSGEIAEDIPDISKNDYKYPSLPKRLQKFIADSPKQFIKSTLVDFIFKEK